MTRYQAIKCADVLAGEMCVFCADEAKAHAVAASLNAGGHAYNYSWREREERVSAAKEWWVVIELKPWTVIPAAYVEPGEVYIGPLLGTQLSEAIVCAGDITSGEKSPRAFMNRKGPSLPKDELAVVQRALPAMYRSELGLGECFVYLDSPSMRYIVGTRESIKDPLPRGWKYSDAGGRPVARVFRIPHWNPDAKVTTPTPAGDPHTLEATLDRAHNRVAHGINGITCVRRLEKAMQTESLCRSGDGFVSTHDEYPLNHEQAALGFEVWRLERKLLARKAREDAVELERNRVLCEDADELPNMVYVETATEEN